LNDEEYAELQKHVKSGKYGHRSIYEVIKLALREHLARHK
jgi:Arc/MetJ-type ribon-helix-helix transcriptional regulator